MYIQQIMQVHSAIVPAIADPRKTQKYYDLLSGGRNAIARSAAIPPTPAIVSESKPVTVSARIPQIAAIAAKLQRIFNPHDVDGSRLELRTRRT